MISLSVYLHFFVLVFEILDESRLGNGWRAGELQNWVCPG